MECEVIGCDVEVTKAGHTLCYDHWTAKRAGLLTQCASCGKLKEGDKPLCLPCYKRKVPARDVSAPRSLAEDQALSATELGERFGVSAQRFNLVVSELGWVSKQHKGWRATPLGLRVGAAERESRQSGIPYVVWPAAIANHKALVAALLGENTATPAPTLSSPPPTALDVNFRDRYSVGAYCSQDGHRVRSRAELVIDDWLYQHRIVHAYERMLPVEEAIVCDFWLPESRVYIEYWGMEQDPEYAARKREKKSVYQKYEMRLVEVGDQELKSLEDHLPRLLRRFGVEID